MSKVRMKITYINRKTVQLFITLAPPYTVSPKQYLDIKSKPHIKNNLLMQRH